MDGLALLPVYARVSIPLYLDQIFVAEKPYSRTSRKGLGGCGVVGSGDDSGLSGTVMAQRSTGLLHCTNTNGFGPLLALNDQYPPVLCGNYIGPKISRFPSKRGLPAIIARECDANLFVPLRSQRKNVGRPRSQKGGALLIASPFPEKPRHRKAGSHNDQPD